MDCVRELEERCDSQPSTPSRIAGLPHPADGVLKLRTGDRYCKRLLSGWASTSIIRQQQALPQLSHERGTPRRREIAKLALARCTSSTVLAAGADVGLVWRGQTSSELPPAILLALCVCVHASSALIHTVGNLNRRGSRCLAHSVFP